MRARSLAEKQQRRADILCAAEDLWTTTPYADLSMNQVASAAQLAKGTLYLYFDTKEELFLALVDGHLAAWIARAAATLEERGPRTPPQLADALLEAGQDSESVRRLLVLLGTVLDRRVRPELLQDFYQNLNAHLERLLALMPLEREVSVRVLRHLYALAIGWQHLSEQPQQSQTRSQPRPGGAQSDPVQGLSCVLNIRQNAAEEEFGLAVRAVIDRVTRVATPA
ncbi:TetR/AcrR family transcriptional regulator [Deinococcus sp. AJ005]|uniref:TetR/AcrR family transcriptional regulator n=1 Tax=Deinococcus sp. AJ005 TaxID=2652443 RepID=UPI001CF60FA6|nr:TetR/AcrR family transcriptional regulator [Deinococcus sp. AJ005]